MSKEIVITEEEIDAIMKTTEPTSGLKQEPNNQTGESLIRLVGLLVSFPGALKEVEEKAKKDLFPR